MNEETIEKIISKHKLYMSMDGYEYEAITKVDLYKLIEEIERLNNIINELEKYINEQIERSDYTRLDTFDEVYDYLQELKGSESNE